MKIQLGVNLKPMSGYLTVDPVGGEGKNQLNFKNLDAVCETGEAEEILCENALDFLQTSEIMAVVSHWMSKLSHGGRIILGGTDLFEVSKAILTQRINTLEANRLLYGEQKHSWDYHYCHISLNDLSELLGQLGLKVIKRRLTDYHMVVEAERL